MSHSQTRKIFTLLSLVITAGFQFACGYDIPLEAARGQVVYVSGFENDDGTFDYKVAITRPAELKEESFWEADVTLNGVLMEQDDYWQQTDRWGQMYTRSTSYHLKGAAPGEKTVVITDGLLRGEATHTGGLMRYSFCEGDGSEEVMPCEDVEQEEE